MKRLIKWGILMVLILTIIIFGINFYVKISTNKLIINSDSKKLDNSDCVLVLGAGIWDNEPSPMLKDRLDVAIGLYNDKKVSKIIMSGDHTKENYDEVNVMKKYAIDRGVKSEDIFMDHAGVSTYDSIYRAKNIFKANKIIIVTQKYHLYRSLYIAKRLNIEAYGVQATQKKYSGDFAREVREILARDKDFIKSMFKPKSKYLGSAIPVSGNGDNTNDKILSNSYTKNWYNFFLLFHNKNGGYL